MLKFSCRVCASDELKYVEDFRSLSRVTSDCKPFPAGGELAVCLACGAVQKPSHKRWLEEIDEIYRNYEIYFQSEGAEQAVFDPNEGVARPRSAVMLANLERASKVAAQGRVIDIGCGRGAFLSAFSKFRPSWELYGYELEPRDAAYLQQIPGFRDLYYGNVDKMPGGYDIISLVHSLEHFTEPVADLEKLGRKLAPDGVLLIEVPNGTVSPFDLLVADHATHFSKKHLAAILDRAGFSSALVADDWIVKELSAVASKPGRKAEPVRLGRGEDDYSRVRKFVQWLVRTVEMAGTLSKKNPGKFGIFGTSIASMWLFGQIGDDVAFFVDEDPNRSRILHGRPVFKPDEVPDGGVVFCALLPHVAQAVSARLARPGIEYISTGPLPPQTV